MTLVLQIENYPALENGAPVKFPVPAQGAKVGRNANMDWSLPDQTRHISSHHFDILVQDGVYYLRDVSTNGTYYYENRERVNGFHRLSDGDRFQVGTYLIAAIIQERTQIVGQDQTVFMAQPSQAAAPAKPTPVQQVAPLPIAPTPPPPVPEPAPQPPAAQQVPIPAPIANPAPVPVAELPEFAPAQAPAQPPAPAAGVEPPSPPEPIPDPEPLTTSLPSAPETSDFSLENSIIPDDPFEGDPFEDLLGPEPVTPEVPVTDVTDDVQKPDYSRIFKEVTGRGLQSPPQADKTGFDDPDMLQAPPSVQIPDLDFIDSNLSDLSTPSMPPMAPDSDDIRGQLSLPPHQLLALEQRAEAAKTQAPIKTPEPSPGDAILKAFCRGAGLPESTTSLADAETLAEALGETARITATEIKLMLEARASTKHFTRGGARTMRRGTDSNPLKFMPDAKQAVDAMFLNPRDGYQTGPAALKDALGDLRVHQTALFAAIQPALLKVIEGLDPAEIEAGTEGGLMSGSGKSWEQFKSLYAARTEGYENGLMDVFLAHFAASYSEMLADTDD